MRTFLEQALDADEQELEGIGVGTNVRLTNRAATGAALLYGDELLHLALFANQP